MGRKKGKAQDVLLSIPIQQSLDGKLDVKARSLPADHFTIYTLIFPLIWASAARLSCYKMP